MGKWDFGTFHNDTAEHRGDQFSEGWVGRNIDTQDGFPRPSL